jgi:polyribonucleotide nucleotidyltransferase
LHGIPGLHISQISKDRINKVEDVLKIGDTIEVKITEIDKQGRVLSISVILTSIVSPIFKTSSTLFILSLEI